MPYTCDGCEQSFTGQRVVFTTEATDERGVDVAVAKRWVTCPACGDQVFSRIGMASPWEDADVRTVIYPDDVLTGVNSGSFPGLFQR